MKLISETLIKKIIKRVINEDKEKLVVKDISGASTFRNKNKKLSSNKYFIIHHTAGRGTANGVVGVLNRRGLGVQWVIDRDGTIYQTLPTNGYGAHILNSDNYKGAPKGINNSNSQGVEVIASNDSDILEVQAIAALKLIKYLGFSPNQIYGHGEINPGHKAADEGRTIKGFVKNNWDKVPKDYKFESLSINPSKENLTPVKPAKSKEYLEYALGAKKIYNPSNAYTRRVGEMTSKRSGGEKIYGVKRKSDDRVFLFSFDNNLNIFYIEMPYNVWDNETKRKERINGTWEKLTQTSVIRDPKSKNTEKDTEKDINKETNTSNTSTPTNIIIGDSQTPYVAAQTTKAKMIPGPEGEKTLHKGGQTVNWLRDAVKNYPVSLNVKNVILCIGTNGGYSNFMNDISGLFSAVKKTFPNAKIFAVQGSWGWGGLKKFTESDVRNYYKKYSTLGATLIEPPIGGIEPHGHKPIYKKIGTAIDSKI